MTKEKLEINVPKQHQTKIMQIVTTTVTDKGPVQVGDGAKVHQDLSNQLGQLKTQITDTTRLRQEIGVHHQQAIPNMRLEIIYVTEIGHALLGDGAKENQDDLNNE